MSATWTIPKREVPVEVVLPGAPAVQLRIFLSENAESHSGFERPSDLLNGPNGFLPAVNSKGEVVLLNRGSLMILSVAVEHEFTGDVIAMHQIAPEELTQSNVDILLEDGTSRRGLLTYLLPAAQRRLQDFLNLPERFLTIQDAGMAHLINKRRIARVTPV